MEKESIIVLAIDIIKSAMSEYIISGRDDTIIIVNPLNNKIFYYSKRQKILDSKTDKEDGWIFGVKKDVVEYIQEKLK